MLMQRSEVLDKVKAIIGHVKEGDLELDQITENSSFQQLGLDSLDLMEVRFDLEAAWGATISDEQAAGLHSVGDVVKLVMEIETLETN